jgi:predicted RNA-binding protein (virulence factor B family)
MSTGRMPALSDGAGLRRNIRAPGLLRPPFLRYATNMQKNDRGKTSPPENPDQPVARVGECALMRAVTVTRAGVFMAWKPGSDLLVPVSQQAGPMKEGKSYVVYLLLDPKGNVIGSTRLHRHLQETADGLAVGQAVDLMIVSDTPLGYKAVVNSTHLGLLHKSEVFQKLMPGDTLPGFIKSIREDRRINLGLQPLPKTRGSLEELADRIVEFLQAGQGVSTLTDNSPPEAIYRQFRVSKGTYKKALGVLKRKGLIDLTKERIRLL